MFGYCLADIDRLTPEELNIYRGTYCGICHDLQRKGMACRIMLTYDAVLLALVLQGVNGSCPESAMRRCTVHPLKQHTVLTDRYIRYAADVNAALALENAIDDRRDGEFSLKGLLGPVLWKNAGKELRRDAPSAAETIRESLKELEATESAGEIHADIPADCFGRLLGGVFVAGMPEEATDEKCEAVHSFGAALGRFIYLMDAAVDFSADLRHGRYNPLCGVTDVPHRVLLEQEASDTLARYEALEIKKNDGILRNILCGGIWMRYITRTGTGRRRPER